MNRSLYLSIYSFIYCVVSWTWPRPLTLTGIICASRVALRRDQGAPRAMLTREAIPRVWDTKASLNLVWASHSLVRVRF